jgi:predicted enzyme related to lactoylglutathione lyase
MWSDLGAADAGQAREFYSALFGWAVAPAGDAGPYQAWITDGQQPWAGITQAGPADGAGWLPYVVVEDLDEAARRHPGQR